MLDEVNNYIDEIKEKKTALQAMNQEFTVEKFRKDYGTWLPTATLAEKVDNIFKSGVGLHISPNAHQNHAEPPVLGTGLRFLPLGTPIPHPLLDHG